MTLLFILTRTVLLQRNTRLPCLSFAAVLFTSLTLNASSYDLVLWTDGSVPFPFGKDGSGVLASWSLCGIETTLFISAGPVCSSFSAEACAILHALCWSRQHQQVCHFSSLLLLSDSHSVLATLFSSLSFLLPQSLSETFLSSPVPSGYNGSPDTRFFRTTTRSMSWPDRERYLFPHNAL